MIKYPSPLMWTDLIALVGNSGGDLIVNFLHRLLVLVSLVLQVRMLTMFIDCRFLHSVYHLIIVKRNR